MDAQEQRRLLELAAKAADEIERLQSMIAGLRADFETAHARMMTSAAVEREACKQACEGCCNRGAP